MNCKRFFSLFAVLVMLVASVSVLAGQYGTGYGFRSNGRASPFDAQGTAVSSYSGLSPVPKALSSMALKAKDSFFSQNFTTNYTPSSSASSTPAAYSGQAVKDPFGNSSFIQYGAPAFTGHVLSDFPMQFLVSYNNSTHEKLLISADQNYVFVGYYGMMSGQSLYVMFANDTSSGFGTTNFTNMHNSSGFRKWDVNFNSSLPINAFFFANLTGLVSTSNATLATVTTSVSLSNSRPVAVSHPLAADQVFFNRTSNSTEFYIPWSLLYPDNVSGFRNLSVIALTSVSLAVVSTLPSVQPGRIGLYYFADSYVNFTSTFSYSATSPFTVSAVYQEYVSHTTISTVGTLLYFPSSLHYSKIVANFQNIFISNVFDTSYSITVSGVEIMAGNTNEFINTYTAMDVTNYSSLFSGVQSVTVSSAQFNPGYASLLSAIFTFTPTSSSGSGYQHVLPVISGGSVPPFSLAGRQPYAENGNILVPYNYTESFNVTFPSNISRLELNLFILQNQNDEFWYGNQPPFREFLVSVNNVDVAAVQPYPNVQTGGIDFMLWEPINAIGANLNPPYAVNLTPFSYLFSGKAQINLTVINDENVWIRVGLNFLYNVNVSQPAVKEVSYSHTEQNNYIQTPGLVYVKNTTGYISPSTMWLNDTNYHNTTLSVESDFISAGNKTTMSSLYESSFFSTSVQFNPEFYYGQEVSSSVFILPYYQISSTRQYQLYQTNEKTVNLTSKKTLYDKSVSTELIYGISFRFGLNIEIYDGFPIYYLSLTINQTREVLVNSSVFSDMTGTPVWTNITYSTYRTVTASGLSILAFVGPGLAFIIYNFGVTASFRSSGYSEWINSVEVVHLFATQYMQAVNNTTERVGTLIEVVSGNGMSAVPEKHPSQQRYSSVMKIAQSPAGNLFGSSAFKRE